MQSLKFTKLSSKYPQKSEKSHSAAVSKEISFNNIKPTTQRTNEEAIAFHAHRYKMMKQPKIIDSQSRLIGEGGINDYYKKNKYPFCNLFKISQALQSSLLPKGISPYHPISINIQNININNIHFHTGPHAVNKEKEMKSTKEEVAYFPIITAPNMEKGSNRNSKEIKKKFKKIRLVDIDKLKSKQPKDEERDLNSNEITKKNEVNEVNENEQKKTIFSNKKIEVVEDSNDSFFDELVDLLHNVEDKPANTNSNTKNEVVFDNIEPDTPIPTEVNVANNNINMGNIYRGNVQRPQTSYGGLSARKKSMQNSLRQKSSKQTTERLFINIPE